MSSLLATRRRKRVGLLWALGVVGLGIAFGIWHTRGSNAARLEGLARRGRVAVWGGEAPTSTPMAGTRWLPVDTLPAVADALHASDARALVASMAAHDVDALLVWTRAGVDARRTSLAGRLAAYEHVPGIRGVYLDRELALYEPDAGGEISTRDREALAAVARGLVGGASPPRIASFPEPLRRVRPAEVMVLLRSGGRARLWRSARGSSIARALLTAAVVARKRWTEREQAMGGPLDRALAGLDIDVSLLADDGTVGEPDAGFVDRAFGRAHGVAYERKGAWRYFLPEATQERGGGRPSRAYAALFAEEGLPADSFEHAELRLYRLVVQLLATSPAPPRAAEPDDGLSDVGDPTEVTGE